MFRLQEQPFGMSADIEAMFLQVQVQPGDAKCLRLVSRESQSDNISTYEYTRHIFGGKDNVQPQAMKKNSQSLPEV